MQCIHWFTCTYPKDCFFNLSQSAPEGHYLHHCCQKEKLSFPTHRPGLLSAVNTSISLITSISFHPIVRMVTKRENIYQLPPIILHSIMAFSNNKHSEPTPPRPCSTSLRTAERASRQYSRSKSRKISIDVVTSGG